jgi:peptidoglycan/xylan/chitin deacetylase (PgdA/CDA1 family)
MYHRFGPETGGLDAQCEILKTHYNPVSLKLVCDYLEGKDSLPANSVAITIDDGYRDFLLAHQVFRKHSIPVTVFLVSDFMDGKLWLWFDQIEYALRQTDKQLLTLELHDWEVLTFPLNSEQERRLAREKICQRLKKIENTMRLVAVKQVVEQLEVEIPTRPPEKYAPLEWHESRKLLADGVEFGVHTKTHPILSRISNPVSLREEIEDSKRRLEEELREPAIHFCYPNGKNEDFNDASIQLISECGFRSAVTTELGMNFGKVDPFLLRRIGVEPTNSLDYFQELLAGVRTS